MKLELLADDQKIVTLILEGVAEGAVGKNVSPSKEKESKADTSGRRRRRKKEDEPTAEPVEDSTEDESDDDEGEYFPMFEKPPKRITQKHLKGLVAAHVERYGRDSIEDFWKEFSCTRIEGLEKEDYADARDYLIGHDLDYAYGKVVEKHGEKIEKDFEEKFDCMVTDIDPDDFEDAFKWLTAAWRK